MTLTCNPITAMAMSHTQAQGQCQRLLGSKITMDTDRPTDGLSSRVNTVGKNMKAKCILASNFSELQYIRKTTEK